MSIEWVPTFGPWLMTYRNPRGTVGVMLSTGDDQIALSAGLLGHAIVVGWRFRREVFRERRLMLGREA